MRKIRRFQFGGSVSGGGLKGIQQTAQGLIGTVNEFSNALINGVGGGGGGGYGGGFGGGFGGTNPYAAPSTPPVNPVYPNIPSMPQNSGYPGSAYPHQIGSPKDFYPTLENRNTLGTSTGVTGFGNDMIEGPYNPNIPGIPGIAGLAGQAQARSNPYARPSIISSGTPSLRNDAIEGAYNPNIPRMGVAANTNPLTGNFSNVLTGNRLNLMKAGGVVKKATTKAKPVAKPKAKAKPMSKPVAKKLSPTRGDGIAQRGKTKGRMV